MQGGYTPEAYYAGTIKEFLSDSAYSEWLSDHLEDVHNAILSKDLPPVSPEQKNAWNSSIIFLRDLLQDTELNEDQWIVLEPILLGTRKRIDVLFCGKDAKEKSHIAILELKTWHTRGKNLRHYKINPRNAGPGDTHLNIALLSREYSAEGNYRVDDVQENTRKQTQGYVRAICSSLKEKINGNKPAVSGAVVLYNCARLSKELKRALEFNLDETMIRSYPIFTKEGCDGSKPLSELAENLQNKLCSGHGEEVYNQLALALHSTTIEASEDAGDVETTPPIPPTT